LVTHIPMIQESKRIHHGPCLIPHPDKAFPALLVALPEFPSQFMIPDWKVQYFQQSHPFPSQWAMVHPDIQTESLKRLYQQNQEKKPMLTDQGDQSQCLCPKCQGNGFLHPSSSMNKHDKPSNVKCKHCMSCKGKHGSKHS
jgi:hypothetical protein